MRLFTRNNMDGVVSAALISKQEDIEEILFVSPRDMQDGKVEVAKGDAISNLPFHPNAGLWFDHHPARGVIVPSDVRGLAKVGPSATRMVFEYYGFEKDAVFSRLHEMVHYTDRMDSAILGYDDVLDPDGWMLLGFILDPRTGLQLSEDVYLSVIHCIRNGMKIRDLLAVPEIRQATRRYFKEEDESKIVLAGHSRVHGSVLVTDLRDVRESIVGNRFVLYAIFPRCSVSVRLVPHDSDPDVVVAAVGKSVFKRTSKVHVGNLLSEQGGGGLEGAGTCQFARSEVDDKLPSLIARLQD